MSQTTHPAPAGPENLSSVPSTAPDAPDAPDAPASTRGGSPRQPRRTATARTDLKVTMWSVIRAEWIKFRSVRSNWIAVVSAGAALVGFAALFTNFASADESARGPGTVTDSLAFTFAGLDIAQLIIAALAAVFVAGEYSTGLIRTMFGAVADRLPVIWAKAIVVAATTWVVMTAAAFAAFFIGQELYSGGGATYALSDPGVLRVILGVGVYSAGVALLGVALGFLLRSSAAAIATLVTVLLIAPGLSGLLPEAVADVLGKILPSRAGSAFTSLDGGTELLSPAAGLGVFAAWVFGLLILAAWRVRRRDA